MQFPRIHTSPRLSLASRIAGIAIAAMCSADASGQSAVTYSDSTFTNASWTIVRDARGPGGSLWAWQLTTGGSGGSFRHTQLTHNASTSSNNSFLTLFHKRLGTRYDPRVSGAIARIDMSMHTRLLQAFPGADGFFTGPVVYQNGRIYGRGAFRTREWSWTHHAITGSTAASFREFSRSTGRFLNSSHPDFSATGAPMEFGYYQSSSHTTPQVQRRRVGVDNWILRVHRQPVQNGQFTPFGAGCGANGRPVLSSNFNQVPRAGQTFNMTVRGLPFGLPQGSVFVMLGLAQLNPPLDLSFIGMTGCKLYVNNLFMLPARSVLNLASAQIAMPSSPGLVFYAQALVLDPRANAAGMSVSNACKGVIAR